MHQMQIASITKSCRITRYTAKASASEGESGSQRPRELGVPDRQRERRDPGDEAEHGHGNAGEDRVLRVLHRLAAAAARADQRAGLIVDVREVGGDSDARGRDDDEAGAEKPIVHRSLATDVMVEAGALRPACSGLIP